MFQIEATRYGFDVVFQGVVVGFAQPMSDGVMSCWWAHVEVGAFAFDGEGGTVNEAIENLSMVYVAHRPSVAL